MLDQVLKEILSFIEWDYTIEKQIASSGQRVVFKAKKNDDNTDCVIKLSRFSDPVSIARYQREVNILKDIDSQYFPKIYKHAFCSKETIDDLKDYLVQENKDDLKNFIEVSNIRSFYLNTEEYIEHMNWGSFRDELLSSEANLKSFFKECFQALDILWKKKIAHRDLKPDNILISSVTKKPVIIDLGIAKSFNDNTQHLTVGQTPCTFQYASPEQIFNDIEQIDYKTDQFSIGILMFFIISSDFPYGNYGDADFMINLKSGNHKILNDYDTDLSPEIIELIHKLISNQPHKRYRKTETIIKTLG